MTFDDLDKELNQRVSKLSNADVVTRQRTEYGRCNGFEIKAGSYLADISFWENPPFIDLVIVNTQSEDDTFNMAGLDYSDGIPRAVEQFFQRLSPSERADS